MGRSAESVHLIAIEGSRRTNLQPEGGFAPTDPEIPCDFTGGWAQPFVRPPQPIGPCLARSTGRDIGAALESASAVRSVSQIVVLPSRTPHNEVFPNTNTVGPFEPREDRFLGKVGAKFGFPGSS